MEEGATVIVSGRKEENLKELNAAYPEIHTIKWDITDIHSASDNIAELDKKYGPIDVFVNNAGVYDAASWDSITEASFDKCADKIKCSYDNILLSYLPTTKIQVQNSI